MFRPSVLLLPLLTVPLQAQNVPSGFTVDTLVGSGLSTPHDLCFLPDGRVLIANGNGTVSLYAGGSPVTVGTVPQVEAGGERGLLSVAADPAFPTNGHVYVYYSSTADGFMHLDRFTCTGDLANPTSTNLQFAASSRHVLLGALPDNAAVHNGGSARFGPDGMLYVSVGDDNDSCSAQLTNSAVGCLLRLDVTSRPAGGSLQLPAFSALDPGNNPLSSANDFSQLVIAHGLRNPFRMEIDGLTGDVLIGDVGESSVEELSEYSYTPGLLPLRNFGWPFREGLAAGPTCGGTQPGNLVAPIATMPHSSGWSSVMGGLRYRNPASATGFGSAYEGNVFTHDYNTGELRRLVPGTNGWTVAAPVPGQPTATGWGTAFTLVPSMRLGPDGFLYYLQHHWNGGNLCRIRPSGPMSALVAVSGAGQRAAAGETFPQPLVARAYDALGNPAAGVPVQFSLSGPGTLSSPNPVTTNANGFAQVQVTAGSAGGSIQVTATAQGTVNPASFSLFARKLVAASAPPLLALQISNQTSASPPQVPYVLMLAFPGSPMVPTSLGTLCVDPLYALSVIIEDGVGMYGGVSFSGTGGMGNPNLSKVYSVPPGLLNGMLMRFQAVGLDPITGWFLTNCAQLQF